MAIAKIKKLEIIGLQKDKDKILGLLQKMGWVELISLSEKDASVSPRIASSDANLLEMEEAISYLASFQENVSFLKRIVQLKPIVYAQKLQDIIANFDYDKLLKDLSELRNHLKNLSQHRERLVQEKHLLLPWRKLKIPLDFLHCLRPCGILLGVSRTNDYTGMLKECSDKGMNIFTEAINQDKTNTYLVILYLKGELEELEAVLKNHHFNFITLSRHKGTVEDRLLEINRETLVLDDQLQDAKAEIAKLSQQRFQLMVAYDYLANLKYRQEVDKNLTKQQLTFYLSSWVKEKDIKLINKQITSEFRNAAIFFSEPRGDETVPVDLENKSLIEPFEFITKLYGLPKYNELDPTPFLAPFFFLYFGFCVSDLGYGLLIIGISLYMLKKFQLGPQGVRFFKLFFFCGISTVIIGALTGSWFGNLLDVISQSNKTFLPLARFKGSLIILDPLANPIKLFSVALSIGIFQIWFGNIVAAIGNIKNKRYLDIVFDQLTILIFLFGMTGLGLIFLKLFDQTHASLFRYAALIGAASLVLTQGRSEKGPGAKLFYGVYNLYNIASGYLSDILSYSRLWALGLVTGVMANTINLISVKFGEIIVNMLPFINKINFVRIIVATIIITIICVVGHLVSFLMNLLGAFIHPLRLQFVEFFSKFFKSGGNPYKPFKIETKYVNLKI